MSLEKIKKVIENFIISDANDALVIKGKYGVGKTHYWRELINNASQESKEYYLGFTKGEGRDRLIGKTHYAYVSLFGINSLESLKTTIFTDLVWSKDINKFSNRSGSASKNFLSKLENIPKIQEYTGGLLGSLAFQEVRNALICFDDIDRKSQAVTITEIIGLANLLKEQHNCKIVLILNEDGFQQISEQKAFRAQVEKLIDYEISFAPETDEILKYVFPDTFPNNEFIKNCCRKLEVNNIRILQKIRRYIEEVFNYLGGLEREVIYEVLQCLILFVYCHYDKTEENPPLEFLEDYGSAGYYSKTIEKNKEEIADKEEEWVNKINKYGYSMTDETDKILLAFVQNGYLDVQAFSEKIEIKNQEIFKQQGENKYRQAWNLYHSSFKDNEKEFIEKLFQGFRSNMNHLKFHQLEETVSTLRYLEADDYAELLINEYLSIRKESIDSLEKFEIASKFQDPYLIQKLHENLDKFEEEFTLKNVLEKLSSRTSYGDKDINFLATVSEDDFYNYFKTFESINSDTDNEFSVFRRNLYNQISAVLRYVNVKDEPHRTIGENAKKAIIRIALINRLNKLRITNWFNKISEEEIEQARVELN